MIKFLNKSELPEDVKISDDMKNRAKFYVTLFGTDYYIPITHGIKKIFKISIRKGVVSIPFDEEQILEDLLRDTIAAVYFQVRDTVGEEICSTLSREIKDQFKELYEKNLKKTITEGLAQKMLKGPNQPLEENKT